MPVAACAEIVDEGRKAAFDPRRCPRRGLDPDGVTVANPSIDAPQRPGKRDVLQTRRCRQATSSNVGFHANGKARTDERIVTSRGVMGSRIQCGFRIADSPAIRSFAVVEQAVRRTHSLPLSVSDFDISAECVDAVHFSQGVRHPTSVDDRVGIGRRDQTRGALSAGHDVEREAARGSHVRFIGGQAVLHDVDGEARSARCKRAGDAGGCIHAIVGEDDDLEDPRIERRSVSRPLSVERPQGAFDQCLLVLRGDGYRKATVIQPGRDQTNGVVHSTRRTSMR